MTDRRRRPQIPTRRIVRSLVGMFLCRLGSLNALAHTAASRFWSGWLGGAMPSADSCGRVLGLMDPTGVRAVAHRVYSRLKRGKALPPPGHGLIAAVFDLHELHATYKQRCPACRQRRIKIQGVEQIQYYHQVVQVQLVGSGWSLPLDSEPMAPGDDEVGAALRLAERAVRDYPRAFDVMCGDARYADSRFFNFALAHGKDALAVLKDQRRDLMADATALIGQTDPTPGQWRGRQCPWWDIQGFTSWPQVHAPVRVVRSLESWSVRRQLTGQPEPQQAEWMWVTTLSRSRASTAAIVGLGHGRWTIENDGFNEMVSRWHVDHLYKHDPTAVEVGWLLAMICLTVFLFFWRRDLKAAFRQAASRLHIAERVKADLFAALPGGPARAPT